jgi:hypothetical protein
VSGWADARGGLGRGLLTFRGHAGEETGQVIARAEAMTAPTCALPRVRTDWYDLENDWHVLRFARPEFRRYTGASGSPWRNRRGPLDDPGLHSSAAGMGWRRFLAPEQFLLWVPGSASSTTPRQELRAVGVTFEAPRPTRPSSRATTGGRST